MPKKSKKSQLVTKRDLDKFATKKELKSEIALVRLDIKSAFERHEEKHKEYRDEILTKMDEVIGELQVMREEEAAGAKILGDHEERITKLESPQSA